MKTLFLVLGIIYLVVVALMFAVTVFMNGKGDQSKQPVIDLIKESFKWPWRFIQFLSEVIS